MPMELREAKCLIRFFFFTFYLCLFPVSAVIAVGGGTTAVIEYTPLAIEVPP